MSEGQRGKGPRFGVVVFPGSNCDHDTYHVLKHVLGLDTVWLWHKDEDLRGCDAIVLPGGFAHGDYLRCGAIARFSPIMPKVIEHAKAGGLLLGICNGFQILMEAGLLPGGLIRNKSLRFLSQDVHVRVEDAESAFTCKLEKGQLLRMPIAHGAGNYFADEATLKKLEDEGRVLLRYASPEGALDERHNVNGSARAIAGILNAEGNVMGLMPHPERAAEPELGCEDGRGIFESLAASAASGRFLAPAAGRGAS